MLKGMGVERRSKRARTWLLTKLGLLAFIMSTPVINFFDKDAHHLECDNDKRTYRKSSAPNLLLAYKFILIFVLDACSAAVDMVLLCKTPGNAELRKKFHRMKKESRR